LQGAGFSIIKRSEYEGTTGSGRHLWQNQEPAEKRKKSHFTETEKPGPVKQTVHLITGPGGISG
jgi:hypothetical protein